MRKNKIEGLKRQALLRLRPRPDGIAYLESLFIFNFQIKDRLVSIGSISVTEFMRVVSENQRNEDTA